MLGTEETTYGSVHLATTVAMQNVGVQLKANGYLEFGADAKNRALL